MMSTTLPPRCGARRWKWLPLCLSSLVERDQRQKVSVLANNRTRVFIFSETAKL
jgi:hypothetical protein